MIIVEQEVPDSIYILPWVLVHDGLLAFAVARQYKCIGCGFEGP